LGVFLFADVGRNVAKIRDWIDLVFVKMRYYSDVAPAPALSVVYTQVRMWLIAAIPLEEQVYDWAKLYLGISWRGLGGFLTCPFCLPAS
jgi:hypothetical protein